VRIGDTVVLDGDLSLIIPVDGESGIVTKVVGQDLPTYTGATEITPSDNEQVLLTENRVVTRNIIVNPIPENYGRLLWSGNTLTVY
jgi:hypothetical protein